jgi:hypothetical protein
MSIILGVMLPYDVDIMIPMADWKEYGNFCMASAFGFALALN